jgi:hypothetical protein
MNGRERALRALEFQPTDRVPVVGGFVRHAGFLARAAGATVADFRASPRPTAIRAFRNLGVDVIIALILPDPRSATGAEHEPKHSSLFKSPEEVLLEIEALPDPAELHRAWDFQAEYDAYLRVYREGQEAVGDDTLWVPNTFHCVSQFQNESRFGAENYYMALALYPDAMDRLFEYSGEQAFLRNTAVARAIVENDLPRVMWLGQDACDNRGPYIAPEKMRAIYLRHVKRSLKPLKDAGIRILWHADGNFVPIAADLLDAGIDGFQGVQECVETKVDVAGLRAMTTRDGRPPVIVGSVSSTSIMPFGSPDEVRADVRRCRKLAQAKGGGWWLNFSSSLGPEVPVENIEAFFEEATCVDGN